MASLARQSLSVSSGSTMKRSNAATSSAANSSMPRSPAISAASAATRFDLSARAARSSSTCSGAGGSLRSAFSRASFASVPRAFAMTCCRGNGTSRRPRGAAARHDPDSGSIAGALGLDFLGAVAALALDLQLHRVAFDLAGVLRLHLVALHLAGDGEAHGAVLEATFLDHRLLVHAAGHRASQLVAVQLQLQRHGAL